QALTGGNGADVVIEAVGRPETYRQAFYARDLAGTLVQVGVPTPDMRIELPLLDLFGRGGALKSSWYGDCLPERDFPMLTGLYLQGRLPLEKFVSETLTLDGIEAPFPKRERGGGLRWVVKFCRSPPPGSPCGPARAPPRPRSCGRSAPGRTPSCWTSRCTRSTWTGPASAI